ncbi:MAG: hypothetical protein J6A98_00480 [Clostridia bacterium]|nr:hypothetical protein [Clostridia bacterium]
MINVKFEVISLSEQIDIIESFFSSVISISQLIADTLGFDISLSKADRDKIITKLYHENQNEMQNAAARFQQAWDNARDFINNEFVKIFGKEFSFNCCARINLNPTSPRFLQEKMFDLHYECTEEYMLLNTVHELVHFAWFEIWKENFPDHKPQEYDWPHLDWLISEIVIEPIFKFSNLKKITTLNPAYDYFYEEKIDGKTLAELANNFYQSSTNIHDFQKNMYNFFHKIDYKKLINI